MKSDADRQKLLSELKKTPIIQAACAKAGIVRATYYRWCEQDESFELEVKEARRESRILINELAEAQLIKKIQDGQNWAIAFWLTHNDSNYMPLNHRLILPEPIQKLTLEQERLLNQMIQLMAASATSVLQKNLIALDQQPYEKPESTTQAIIAQVNNGSA